MKSDLVKSKKIFKLGELVAKFDTRLERAVTEGKGDLAHKLYIRDAYELRKVVNWLCNEEYNKACNFVSSLDTEVRDQLGPIVDLLEEIVEK